MFNSCPGIIGSCSGYGEKDSQQQTTKLATSKSRGNKNMNTFVVFRTQNVVPSLTKYTLSMCTLCA